MSTDFKDHYETMQLSVNAEPETVTRVYRLLAQRYHPDNQDTGSSDTFQRLHEAYSVLSDPQARAEYDVAYHRYRRDRWRVVGEQDGVDDRITTDRRVRFALLELLYTKRRTEPRRPGVGQGEAADLLGVPDEHMEFIVWYLLQRKLVVRDDEAQLIITVDGIDEVEREAPRQPRNLLLRESRKSS
jgi:curved DNA-binding protein CbpA